MRAGRLWPTKRLPSDRNMDRKRPERRVTTTISRALSLNCARTLRAITERAKDLSPSTFSKEVGSESGIYQCAYVPGQT